MHLTYKICQGKFDRVKGALLHGIKERKYGSNLAAKSPFTAIVWGNFGLTLDVPVPIMSCVLTLDVPVAVLL